MIFANINPTASYTIMNTPFNSTTVISNYMGVIAVNYAIGSDQVNFKLVFGNISENNEFYNLFTNNITMTNEELSSWGADDSVLLTLICTKIGTTAASFITTNLGDDLSYL